MANPVPVECVHHQVTKIATAVTSIDIIKGEGGKAYYATYRLTGEVAPIPPSNLDQPRLDSSSEWLLLPDYDNQFRTSQSADVYIFCTNGRKDLNGYVRVDS